MKHSPPGTMQAPSASGTRARAEGTTQAKVSILIVDDSKTVAFVLRTYLTNCGYDFEIASNAADAMRCVMKAKPDVVITDVQMPGGSGFELITALRKLPGLSTVRYFLMTSSWTAERRRYARLLRVEACLQKPVDADQLLKLIQGQAAVSTVIG